MKKAVIFKVTINDETGKNVLTRSLQDADYDEGIIDGLDQFTGKQITIVPSRTHLVLIEEQ